MKKKTKELLEQIRELESKSIREIIEIELLNAENLTTIFNIVEKDLKRY